VSWNWQRYKDEGQPIYEAAINGNMVHLRLIKRVIHHSSQFEGKTFHSVRYKSRWQPLHRAKLLGSEMVTPNGSFRVYLNGRRIDETTEKLPFICTWEQPGHYYQVFGY
jgi:hypothetical protein